MANHNQKGRSKNAGRFIMHEEWMLKSEAYRALSAYARSLLTELKRRYYGENNGDISMSTREAALLIPCSKNKATQVFRELAEKGFIRSKQKGAFDYKIRHATTWVLTEYPYVGQLPTKDFLRWKSDVEPSPEKKHRSHQEGPYGPTTRDRDQSTVPPEGTDSPTTRDRDAQNTPPHGPTTWDTYNIPYTSPSERLQAAVSKGEGWFRPVLPENGAGNSVAENFGEIPNLHTRLAEQFGSGGFEVLVALSAETLSDLEGKIKAGPLTDKDRQVALNEAASAMRGHAHG